MNETHTHQLVVAGALVTLGKIPAYESLPSSVQAGFVPIPDFRRLVCFLFAGSCLSRSFSLFSRFFVCPSVRLSVCVRACVG